MPVQSQQKQPHSGPVSPPVAINVFRSILLCHGDADHFAHKQLSPAGTLTALRC